MKNKLLIVLAVAVLLASCGPKISGKDEESFKISKAKMEEKLDKEEKETLEKALRVIVLKAMTEKFNHPDDPQYKEKSFNAISLAMIDGKTFSGIVSYAEDFLKKDRDEDIKKTEAELDSLNTKRKEFEVQNKEINNFKLTKISISEDESFDEKKPYLDLTFENKLNAEVFYHKIQIDIRSKKTGEMIDSQIYGTGTSEGDALVDGEGIAANATYEYHQSLLSGAIEHSNLWKTAKYPITDFTPYDLVIEVYPISVTTKNKTIKRAENFKMIDLVIDQLKKKLTELKDNKGTLAELDLVD
ncbi:MAG: hypothetical protein EOO96_04550 [Pedobacter sp.]|nr:MAG: hypothetical protein EOO96_04550 [Pedobacter sp.]